MLGLFAFRRDMLVLFLFVLAIGSITANILITLINVTTQNSSDEDDDGKDSGDGPSMIPFS